MSMQKSRKLEHYQAAGITSYDSPHEHKAQAEDGRAKRYTNAEILEMADPGRADAGHQRSLGQAVEAAPAMRPLGLPELPRLPRSFKTPKLQKDDLTPWDIESTSLTLVPKSEIIARFNVLSAKCNTAAQSVTSAIQHFELHNQIFTSSCDLADSNGAADIIASYRAVSRAATELFAPQSAYAVSVSNFRLFVVNLIQRLSETSNVRAHATMAFNEISGQYHTKEEHIREKIMAILRGEVQETPRMKVMAYMRVQRERAETMTWHQTCLEMWAHQCIRDLGEGYAEFQEGGNLGRGK